MDYTCIDNRFELIRIKYSYCKECPDAFSNPYAAIVKDLEDIMDSIEKMPRTNHHVFMMVENYRKDNFLKDFLKPVNKTDMFVLNYLMDYYVYPLKKEIDDKKSKDGSC